MPSARIPVVYASRNECCGGYVALDDPETAKKRSNVVSHDAASHGAEAIVTACPLCRYNLVKSGSEDTGRLFHRAAG